EDEEHQEKGATKVLKKVKEKAKKIKNSLTKHGHGHEHDHDVEIEDDEYDEQDPQLHGSPSFHPGEASVPASEEIVPPGTKSFPVVSSDYTKPVEPEPLRETLYRHEAASYPADISDRDEWRDTHQTPMKTPASLLSSTEDVTRTITPGADENLGGQGKVDVERPKKLEEDPAGPGGGSSYLSGVSNYQSKVTDPTHAGGGEAGVPEIVESLGRMKVTDEKPGRGFESDFPTRSHEFGLKNESETGKDIPARSDDVKVESELGSDLPTGTHEQFSPELSPPKESHEETHEAKQSTYTEKIGSATSGEAGEDYHKSGLGTELASESETELGKDLPTRSFESETVFGGKPETEPRDDFPAKGREFEQTTGSGIGEDNGAGKEGTERREDFLGKGYEFDQEIESTFGKDSPTRLPGDEIFPTRSDDMEVEIGSGRGLPTETDDDHFSPEFSGPKERDDFDSQAEQTRYEAAEVKPTTYSEMIGSSTGYSSGQHESPVSVETVADKLTTEDENVKETASPVTAKLPFSGDGSEVDETEQGEDKFVASRDHLEEKLTPEEEEDKAFSDMVAEKLNLGEEKQAKIKEEVAEEKIPSDKLPEEIEGGEAVQEEGKEGGGIVGTIKGVYNYWLGGTEEVKPKSPNSVEES
ncbi:unnamed protein product, partial [Brassica rapa subsp. narinosa]